MIFVFYGAEFCFFIEIFNFAGMKTPARIFSSVWCFYRDGFRRMTWGRTLWLIILIKLFVIFVVLRLFFFRPVLAGMSDSQKSDAVATGLTIVP